MPYVRIVLRNQLQTPPICPKITCLPPISLVAAVAILGIEHLEALGLAVNLLVFVAAMQLLELRLRLSRHTHNLHDMCLLEQDLPLCSLVPSKSPKVTAVGKAGRYKTNILFSCRLGQDVLCHP